jgi:hypothetical protein
VGTFVKEPRARSSLLELRNIAEEIAARGHAHSAEIEAAERVMASAALAGNSAAFSSMPCRIYWNASANQGINRNGYTKNCCRG